MSASDVFVWVYLAFFVMALVGIAVVLIAEFLLWLYDEIDDRRK